MLTENVYYSEQPKQFYLYPYDGARMCRADFPVDVTKIDTEEGKQYLCNVYSLRTAYFESLEKDIESDYKTWLERAKEYTEARKRMMLKSILRATNSDDAETRTYTTTLGRTVYGGTLDVVSGELVVDRGYIASYNGETLPSTWISDRDEYASGTTPTIGAEVVYDLATPQTIQLTPQQVMLLTGNNNVWSDGEVEMVYSVELPTDGEVSYPLEGEYEITYSATDKCGNIGEAIRHITVQ